MADMPKDPVMLLSYINMKLRDFYSSIEELCSALSVKKEDLDEALSSIDYSYDREKNQYV